MNFDLLIPLLGLVMGIQCTRVENPRVMVKPGIMEGSLMNTFNDRKFYAFRKIPYAKPPVGLKRFKIPELLESWDGILDATEDGPFCPQLDFVTEKINGDEDCLYLNVYTPKLPSDTSSVKLPVMIFIHGGGFTGGSGTSVFADPKILMNKDVILVTINYRLGALGFLATEDNASPGNYGLWDQRLAFQWVQENINAFGGNKDLVTIFGPSAGGASVAFHLVSSASKGLFHRAIVQSGSALCPWAIQKQPLRMAERLGQNCNCSVLSSEELINCLKEKDVEEIIMKSKITLKSINVPFGPSVDSFDGTQFFEESPANLLSNGHINHVPVIAGITANEGLIFALTEIQKMKNLQGKELKKHLESSLADFGDIEIKDVPEVLQLYMKNVSLTNVNDPSFVSAYVEAVSDALFGSGFQETVLQLSKHNVPVYAYKTEYQMNDSYAKLLFGENITGVSHAEDMSLVINIDPKIINSTNSAELEGDDKVMSNKITDMWVNFATFGNPTPHEDSEVIWTPTVPGKINYLRLNLSLKMEYSSPSEKLKFWKEKAVQNTTKERIEL